ncbi:O-antigen/teichoic acid export membrane protein [Rhodococcus sp. 27YEA15]|uniref:lipopolysaccharide biosynthesis protein n=1 Tax=Rhodococcus sp. 27YEA15 TaxID=3156259 RepID=UPI003C7A7CE3
MDIDPTAQKVGHDTRRDNKHGPEKSGLGKLGLELDLAAVMTSSAMTGILGFLFWTVAARGFTVSDVGRASAIISAATMSATLATVNLGSVYERFLPLAGRSTHRSIRAGLLTTTALAVLLGIGLVVVGPRERLFGSWTALAWFPLCVVTLSLFALLDPILIGLRRARHIAVKNISQSVAKLVAVAVFALALANWGILVAVWVVPAAAVTAVIWFRVVRPVVDHAGGPPRLPPRRELWHYFIGTYAMTVVGVLVPLTVPLVVVGTLGTEANAFFNMCWLLVSTIAILIGSTAAPYIAAVAAESDRSADATTRFMRVCFAAGVGGSAFLLTFGPLILRAFGSEYAAAAGGLVRLMALTLPFVALMTVYSALARVHRKLRLATAVQWTTAVGIVGGISLATPWWGLQAIGIVYLSVEVAAACVIAVPLTGFLRSIYRPATSNRGSM